MILREEMQEVVSKHRSSGQRIKPCTQLLTEDDIKALVQANVTLAATIGTIKFGQTKVDEWRAQPGSQISTFGPGWSENHSTEMQRLLANGVCP